MLVIAVQRLERVYDNKILDVKGIFRGRAMDSAVFDLRDDDGVLVSKTLDSELSEANFDRISALTNKTSLIQVSKTTIRNTGGHSQTKYVLLDAQSLDGEITLLEEKTE